MRVNNKKAFFAGYCLNQIIDLTTGRIYKETDTPNILIADGKVPWAKEKRDAEKDNILQDKPCDFALIPFFCGSLANRQGYLEEIGGGRYYWEH